MCGLVAWLRTDGRDVDPRRLRMMTDIIRHRGPDDDGYFSLGRVGLGFRRLAIQDLTLAGHQPMTDADGQVVLVFNGEIYNFLEIRSELIKKGHTFKSTGDTEVLLHAYLQWGKECVSRLNGMWAFVIYDARVGKIFGSRDRLGVKPLYRYAGRNSVLFASEIKAIRASGEHEGGVNWAVASDFLLRGALDRGSASFYQDISQVSAGCTFDLDLDGRYRESRYWSVRDIQETFRGNPTSEYRELFERSVQLQMRSDVVVGMHLSGGLDSTAIICAAARERTVSGSNEPILAFSFQTPEYDERQYIDATIQCTRSRLIPLETSALKVWEDLPRVLWFQDEPVHSLMAVVSFQLMALTKAHGVKVILNGQGSDETAAGYSSYFESYWHSLMRAGRLVEMFSEIKAFTGSGGQRLLPLLAKQVELIGRSALSQSNAYRAASRVRERAQFMRHGWYSRDIVEQVPARTDAPIDGRLRPTLERSVTEVPLPLYLRIEDRNSSAHSIESRVPFLDHKLVELLFGITDNWRLRGPFNKVVLREAMRHQIPEVVRTRIDKMGFPVPSHKWFAGSLYEPLRDLLDSRIVRERGLFNIDSVIADLDRFQRGEIPWSRGFFDIAQFELWSQQASNLAARVD